MGFYLSSSLSPFFLFRSVNQGGFYCFVCQQLQSHRKIFPMNSLQQFSLVLIGIIILIICYSLIGNYCQHKHIHILHETGIGIIIGFLFGGILYLGGNITQINFDQEIFFYGLLPPMIFAGGYNLKKKDFGKNFKYILIYGLVGTITSFGIIFGLTVLVNEMHWIVPLRSDSHIQHLETALMIKYSATISATDSVAALTLIKSSEFPKIFSIIFGEGMVNDAVAIILFKVVGGIFDEIAEHGGMSFGETASEILGSFLTTIIFSVLIGVLSAILCSFMFRKFRFLVESEVAQVVITYLFGILSYVAAEYYDLSGVITVLICGVVLAHYNFYNLSVGGMHATAISFQSISFMAEAIVFVYLGVSTIYYFTTEVISLSFIGLELLICIIARLVSIFGLSALFRLYFKKKWTVSANQLWIISIAGTIRGSVAFALILTIQSTEENKDQVSVIKSTTLIMVCLTTIVLGGLMPKFIKYFLGDSNKPHTQVDSLQTEEEIKQSQHPLIEEEHAQQNQLAASNKPQKKPGFFKYSDQNYWRPFLIWNYAQRKSDINMYKKMMKYNSRGDYQGGNFTALVMRNADLSKLDEFVTEVQRKDKEKGSGQMIKEQANQED